MSEAIVHLFYNRELLRNMSSSIRAEIEKNWNPAIRSKLRDQMFHESLAGLIDT
jgi:hypothetical protein